MSDSPEIGPYQKAVAERRRQQAEQIGKLAYENQRFRQTWADHWQDGTVVVRINGGLYVLKNEAKAILLAAARLIPEPEGDAE